MYKSVRTGDSASLDQEQALHPENGLNPRLV
jgi:hypothetical protein